MNPNRRRPPSAADAAAGAARGGRRAASRWRCSRSCSSGCGSCRCCPGDQYLAQATRQPRRARSTSRRRAARSSTAAATCSSTPSPRSPSQISPADLPVPLQPMLMAHPPRRDMVLYNRLADVLGMSTKRTKCPIDGYGVRRLSPIALRRGAGLRAAPLPERDDQDRRLQGRAVLPRRAPAAVPRRQRPAGVAAPLPAGDARRAAVRDGRADHAAGGQRSSASAAFRRTRSSASRAWSGTTTATCAARTAPSGSRSTPSATSRATCRRRKPAAGPLAQAVAGRQPPAGRPAGAADTRSTPTRRRTAGAFVAMDPRQRRGLRDGLAADLQPEHLHQAAGVPASTYKQLNNASSNFPLINRAILSAVPDRIDVQADHGDRGAPERRLDHRRHLRRHGPVLQRSGRPAATTPATRPTACST